MPKLVIDATIDEIQLEAEIIGYEAEDQDAEGVDAVNNPIAALIDARSSEIAVGAIATHAWDMALYGINFASGDRILTSFSEIWQQCNHVPPDARARRQRRGRAE